MVGLLQLSNESHKVMEGLVTLLPSVEDGYNSTVLNLCGKAFTHSFCLISLAKLWHLACQSNGVGGTVKVFIIGFSIAVSLAVGGFPLFSLVAQFSHI